MWTNSDDSLLYPAIRDPAGGWSEMSLPAGTWTHRQCLITLKSLDFHWDFVLFETLTVFIPGVQLQPLCSGSRGAAQLWSWSAGFPMKRGAIINQSMEEINKSQRAAPGRFIRYRSDAFAAWCEGRFRRSSCSLLGHSLSTVSLPMKMWRFLSGRIFSLSFSFPPLLYPLMNMSRITSCADTAAGAAGERQVCVEVSVHISCVVISSSLSFPLPLRRTQRNHCAANFSRRTERRCSGPAGGGGGWGAGWRGGRGPAWPPLPGRGPCLSVPQYHRSLFIISLDR